MNPTGPNENFQESQIRSYAEAIYDATSSRLVEAITSTLGLTEDKDVDGNPIVMDFDYAYGKMKEAGYAIDHRFIENGGSCELVVRVFKLENELRYPVRTTFSVGIGDDGQGTLSA